MYWSNFARGEARFTVPCASNIGKCIAPYYSNIVSVLQQKTGRLNIIKIILDKQLKVIYNN